MLRAVDMRGYPSAKGNRSITATVPGTGIHAKVVGGHLRLHQASWVVVTDMKALWLPLKIYGSYLGNQ